MFGLLWGGVGPVWVPACDIAPFPTVVKMDSRWGLFTVCGNGVRPNLNANNPRATERLGGYPILAIGTVQVTAQHSEAVGQCPRIGMEEGFLFDRVALHYTGVAPGNV